MKKLIQDSTEVFGRYDGGNLQGVIERMTHHVNSLPKDQRASARFEVDNKNYDHDDNDYPTFMMTWMRPETDAEEQKREAQEAAWKEQQAVRDRAEFERLKKQFGQ